MTGDTSSADVVEAAIGAVVGVVVDLAVTYYFLRPDKLEDHLEIVRSQWQRFQRWISIQQTLANIRNLPETRNSCNT